MQYNFRLMFIFLLSISFTGGLLSQVSISDLLEEIEIKLHEKYDSSGAAGGIIGIVLADGTYGASAIGYSDIEKKKKMVSEHLMLGGSTGKIFVSALTMQLVGKGNLELDKPISEYLGHLAWFSRLQNADALTLRHLMRHTSGISRYVFQDNFLTEVLADKDRIWQPQELISYVLDLEPLFKPGSDFAYSDTNFIIVAMIIEEVTGRKLYDLINENILKPHDLKRIIPQTDRNIPGLASGYNGDDDPFFPGKVSEDGLYRYNLQFEWAGGGYIMNPQDLARAGKLIYEGKVFSPDLLPTFFDGIDAGRLGGTWGLGVHVKETEMGTSYGHSGFFPGYITNMEYFPEKKIAIAYQVNTSDTKHRQWFRAISEVANEVVKNY